MSLANGGTVAGAPGSGGLSQYAGCEPVPGVRDGIARDLKIIGEMSCPQKVNMEAIIPVYPLYNSQPISKFYKFSNSVVIGGTNGYTFRIFDMMDVPASRIHGIINYFYIRLWLDPAGRAAMAAGFLEAIFQFRVKSRGSSTGIYPFTCRGSFPAAVGYDSIHVVSNIVQTPYTGITPNEVIPIHHQPYVLNNWHLAKNEGLEVVITREDWPNNWPANTALHVGSLCTVYGLSNDDIQINTTPLI
jgi:hypothetical protein